MNRTKLGFLFRNVRDGGEVGQLELMDMGRMDEKAVTTS
jgi:hypothetical protein